MAVYLSDKDGNLVKFAGLIGGSNETSGTTNIDTSNLVERTVRGINTLNTYGYIDAENRDGIAIDVSNGNRSIADAIKSGELSDTNGSILQLYDQALIGSVSVSADNTEQRQSQIGTDPRELMAAVMSVKDTDTENSVTQGYLQIDETWLQLGHYKTFENSTETYEFNNSLTLSSQGIDLTAVSQENEYKLVSLSLHDGKAFINNSEIATKDDIVSVALPDDIAKMSYTSDDISDITTKENTTNFYAMPVNLGDTQAYQIGVAKISPSGTLDGGPAYITAALDGISLYGAGKEVSLTTNGFKLGNDEIATQTWVTDTLLGEGAAENLNTISELSAALKNNENIIDTLAVDTNVVHLTGDETLNGIKTFKSTGTVDFGDSYYPIILSGNRQGIKFEDSLNIHIGGEHFSPNAGGIGIGNNLKFYGSTSNYYNIMLGWNLATNKQAADSGDSSIVIGYNSSSSHSETITMGFNAITNAEKAIQLGKGTNSSSKTFQVFDYQLLDANGKIPNERLNLTESTMTVGETEVTLAEVASLATTAVQSDDIASSEEIDAIFA